MTTVEEIILDARAFLDNYTEDGVIISDEEVSDLIASGIRFANIGQRELHKVGLIQQTYEFTNIPIKNVLGDGANFELAEFTGTDKYLPNESGVAAKSYNLEANATHTIVIQELESSVWTDLITLSGVSLDMTRYAGNITPTTEGNLIRIKFSGSSYYRYTNVALFEYLFQSDDDVPVYAKYVKRDMPENFKQLVEVNVQNENRNYISNSVYLFEKPNKFYYDYYFNGRIRIVYNPIPSKITSKDDILDLDDVTATILSYYVASWIAPYENQSMTNPLFQKYAELKAEAMQGDPVSQEDIHDEYGIEASANNNWGWR